MDRRTFIVALVGVLLAGLRDAACAQQTGKAWRIGFLANVASTDLAAARIYEAAANEMIR